MKLVRIEIQKQIVVKALRECKAPFTVKENRYLWQGGTSVRSKATGRSYEVSVDIEVIPSNPRLNAQFSACLCKEEGSRLEDLEVATLVDPRVRGTVRLQGLPGTKNNDAVHDLGKLLKS